MTKKVFILLFTCILLLGGFLRFYKLGEIPVSLYWDETAMLADAKFVAETGKDIHGNSWWQTMFVSYGDYKLPVYIWLAVISVKILGANSLALRLPSAVLGMMTILLAGWLSKELFSFQNRFVSPKLKWLLILSTSFVVAVAPWSVLFSRTGFEGHIGQFFLGLAVSVMLLSKKQNNWKKIVLLLVSQIIAGIATYSYFSVRFVWPVVFLVLSVLEIDAKTFSNKSFILSAKKIFFNLLTFAFYALILLPMFLSPLYEKSNQFRLSTTSVINMRDWAIESNQLRDMAGNSLVDRVLFHRSALVGKALLENFADNLSLDFLFLHGDQNLRHGTGHHGLYLFVFLPFLFSGLYFLYLKNKQALSILIIWWIIALLPASVPDTTPHALRSLNALIPLSITIGTGLSFVIEKILWTEKNIFAKIFGVGYVVLTFISIASFSIYYFQKYPKLSASDWQEGFEELAKTINRVKKPVRTVWVNVNDGRYFLWQFAYGENNLQEIQKYMANKTEPETISNISFAQFDWRKLESLDHKLVVVGTKDEIDSQISHSFLTPTWREDIAGKNGETLYSLVGFGQ